MPRRRGRLDPTARIAIVGSGLAALSTAVSLERVGFSNIAIYERDASHSSRQAGYGLTLQYNPSGVLAKLNMLNAIADADCPSRSHYMFDWRGNIIGYFGNAFSPEIRGAGWGQRGNLRVPRQEVRRILLDQLRCSAVHWNHRLVDVKRSGVSPVVKLIFEHCDTVVIVEADFVVGADGIRSTVVEKWLPEAPTPQPLGVRLIVGLTEDFHHDLLHERGFYTLAKGMRLFCMPFSSPSPFDETPQPVRYMWQLSFCSSDDTESSRSKEMLCQEAIDLTESWHEPVPSMIRSTPAASVWGTHLCDRDPTILQHLMLQRLRSDGNAGCVVIVGDALHAMSPFKGQGANQSLRDGVAVAKWLLRASPPAAVQGCMREMIHRTAAAVGKSREAAAYWHSSEASLDEHPFAVDSRVNSRDLLTALHGSITAETPQLDEQVARIVQGMSEKNSEPPEQEAETVYCDTLKQEAVQAATLGDRGRLRELSWRYPSLLSQIKVALMTAVRDDRTLHWLVTEAGCGS
jgi:salicylate hydroxylase